MQFGRNKRKKQKLQYCVMNTSHNKINFDICMGGLICDKYNGKINVDFQKQNVKGYQ